MRSSAKRSTAATRCNYRNSLNALLCHHVHDSLRTLLLVVRPPSLSHGSLTCCATAGRFFPVVAFSLEQHQSKAFSDGNFVTYPPPWQRFSDGNFVAISLHPLLLLSLLDPLHPHPVLNNVDSDVHGIVGSATSLAVSEEVGMVFRNGYSPGQLRLRRRIHG